MSVVNQRDVKRYGAGHLLRIEIDDLREDRLFSAIGAEFFGTMLLVLFGCPLFLYSEPFDVVRVALGFGFTIATLTWCMGHVSGGHFNPAVSFAMYFARRMTILRMLIYTLFQILGGIFGAILLYFLIPRDEQEQLGATMPADDLRDFQVFMIELIITMLMVMVVLANVDHLRSDLDGSYPLAIGLSVIAGQLWAVPLTGGSMNPARSFASATVTGIWESHWAYWFGPLLGGIIGGMVYEFGFAINASRHKFVAAFIDPDYHTEDFDEHGNRIDGGYEMVATVDDSDTQQQSGGYEDTYSETPTYKEEATAESEASSSKRTSASSRRSGRGGSSSGQNTESVSGETSGS